MSINQTSAPGREPGQKFISKMAEVTENNLVEEVRIFTLSTSYLRSK